MKDEERCEQNERAGQCHLRATHRYYWPGRGWHRICDAHLPRFREIAEVMGIGDTPIEALKEADGD